MAPRANNSRVNSVGNNSVVKKAEVAKPRAARGAKRAANPPGHQRFIVHTGEPDCIVVGAQNL